MTIEMKYTFKKLVLWAIRKTMEKHPGETFCRYEFEKQLREAWEDLEDAGIIVDENATSHEGAVDKGL